jgi:hypothetical protein
MANKLRNIEAIRKMLDGTHRMQTKKSFGYEKQNVTRNVGDVWTDENGVEWEQKEGYKINRGKFDELRAYLQSLKMPSTCPKCSGEMKGKAHEKMWKLFKHCLNCQVEAEHKMKLEGTLDQFYKEFQLRNAEAWLKDAEQEAKEIVHAIRSKLAFANSDGTVEEWSGGIDADELADKIEKEFETFKENFINKLKDDNRVENADPSGDSESN